MVSVALHLSQRGHVEINFFVFVTSHNNFDLRHACFVSIILKNLQEKYVEFSL